MHTREQACKKALHILTDAKGVSTRYHLCYVVKTTYLCRLIPKPLSGNGDNSFSLTSDCFWRYTKIFSAWSTCKFCHLSATDRFCATVQKLPSTQHVLVTSLSRWMSFSFRCLCVLLFLITFFISSLMIKANVAFVNWFFTRNLWSLNEILNSTSMLNLVFLSS